MEKNICQNCIHYIGNLKCFAFDNKIPIEIITGKNNHKSKLANQKNDLIFEKL